jgi:hypothetical protein
VELKSVRLRPGATVTAMATGEKLTWRVGSQGAIVNPPQAQPERASPVYTLKIVGAA